MNIIESKNYQKSYIKVLKNKTKEKETIEGIKRSLRYGNDLHEVLISPYKVIYHIEQKKGNLKEFYTARINSKIRLIMKPIGSYPYDTIQITDIEFVDIDDKHYKEG